MPKVNNITLNEKGEYEQNKGYSYVISVDNRLISLGINEAGSISSIRIAQGDHGETIVIRSEEVFAIKQLLDEYIGDNPGTPESDLF